MKKKGIWLLALSLLLTLPGCRQAGGQETPEPTPTPVWTEPAEEQAGFVLPYSAAGGFHPITGSNRINLTLTPLLYEGLFAVDNTFTAQLELCSGYTVSEDGLTWTFRLREKNFSDGSPLTGAEVAASLNTARQSQRFQGRLRDIVRVTAGEGEVTVTLSRPNGDLPSLLDVPIVKETGEPQRPLGTGHYYLEESGEGLTIRLTEPWAQLDTIPLRPIAAEDDLVYAFDTREISLVNVDLTGTNALGYSGRYETADYPTTTMLYVGYNLRSEACREETVRQALALALDRQEVAGRLLAGHAVAAALPIHPASPLYDSGVAAGAKTDLAAARALLEGAGWSYDEAGRLRRGRSGLTLRLAVNQENTYKVAVAEALAGDLTALGCEVTVEKLPWEDFVSALQRRDFDLYLGETTLTADFDLEALLAPGGSLNYGGCQDGELSEALTAFREADGEERQQAASALCARLVQVAPITPLCFKNGSLLTQWGQVWGTKPSPTQHNVFAGFDSWRIGLG